MITKDDLIFLSDETNNLTRLNSINELTYDFIQLNTLRSLLTIKSAQCAISNTILKNDLTPDDITFDFISQPTLKIEAFLSDKLSKSSDNLQVVSDINDYLKEVNKSLKTFKELGFQDKFTKETSGLTFSEVFNSLVSDSEILEKSKSIKSIDLADDIHILHKGFINYRTISQLATKISEYMRENEIKRHIIGVSFICKELKDYFNDSDSVIVLNSSYSLTNGEMLHVMLEKEDKDTLSKVSSIFKLAKDIYCFDPFYLNEDFSKFSDIKIKINDIESLIKNFVFEDIYITYKAIELEKDLEVYDFNESKKLKI